MDQEDETLTDIESSKPRTAAFARIEGVDVRDARTRTGPRRRWQERRARVTRAICCCGRRRHGLAGSAWFDLAGLFLEGLVVEYDDRLSDFLLAYACAQKLPEARVETAERPFDRRMN